MPPPVAALLGIFAGFTLGQVVAVVLSSADAPLAIARALPILAAVVGGVVGFSLARRSR